MSRKRIGLFLDPLPHTGGTFQYNQTILEAVAALPTNRYDVVVGCTSDTWLKQANKYAVKSIVIKYGFTARFFGILVNYFNIPLRLCQKLSPLFQATARSLLREKCDLWIFPSQDVLSYQAPLPSLVTVLDLAHRYEKHFAESASKSEYLIRERTYSSICGWARGVLVQTDLGRQQVVDAYGMPVEKIYILPLVAPGHIYATAPPADFNDRYRLPPKYLFYPAQFWEHKNHRNLLAAMSQIKNELPDLQLVLAGSKKSAYEAVLQQIKDSGLTDDVSILGYVPDEDIPELYRRARALIMPTFFGPSNIPPLEAAVLGCPIAISNVSRMPEQLGDSTLIFDPDSVDEIADCIRTLWSDDPLCARMAAEAKERVSSWGQTEFNARLHQIIAEITATPSASRTAA
jgi:glycosyltransferase involved in cell wall biosynthesis